MNTTGTRAFFVGLALAVLAPATVAGPPEMYKSEGSGGPFVAPILTAGCGFEVIVQYHFKTKYIFFDDGRTRQYAWQTVDFTNPATGAELQQNYAVNILLTPYTEIVDEVEGTRTVISYEEYKGVLFKLLQPGTGVLLMSRGNLTFQVAATYDLDSGDLIDVSTEVTNMNGPHPWLFALDEAYLAIACAALS